MNAASSKPADQQVAALEQAILDRANELAEELRGRAEHRRDTILREATERLRRDEEREIAAARASADRAQRRQVQANELRLQGQLDQLRWELVQAVESRLIERMATLQEDRESYRAWLIEMLAEAAGLIPDVELLAEVTATDHEWLNTEWVGVVEAAAPGRVITLNPQPTWGQGGVKVRSADNSAQVDNRFEGRLARIEGDIQRIILERLFPGEGRSV